MEKIKSISTVILIFVFTSFSLRPPDLKEPHLPKIRDEINAIIKKMKSAELVTTSKDGNRKRALTEEYKRRLTSGEPTNKIQDTLNLLINQERQELIDEIVNFKKAHISQVS